MYLQKHITIIFCFTFISEEASYNRPGKVSDKVTVLKLAYLLTYETEFASWATSSLFNLCLWIDIILVLMWTLLYMQVENRTYLLRLPPPLFGGLGLRDRAGNWLSGHHSRHSSRVRPHCLPPPECGEVFRIMGLSTLSTLAGHHQVHLHRPSSSNMRHMPQFQGSWINSAFCIVFIRLKFLDFLPPGAE